MKAKKAAIFVVSATLAMSTVGAVSVLADPPAMSGAPSGEMAGGQMPGGQFSNGQMPGGQMPNSQAPQGQSTENQKPEGQASNSQTTENQAPNGQMPNSQATDGQSTDSQKTEDQAPNSQTTENQAPNGQMPSSQTMDGQTTDSQKPEGQTPDGKAPEMKDMVKVTVIQDGKVTVEIRNITNTSEKPEENASDDSAAETKEYDLSSAEILKESAGKTEKATLDDIKADSMLEFEFNEDGSVKTVIIREKPEGQIPDGQAPDGQAPNGQAPDGQAPNGQAPDGQAPNGQAPEMKDMVKVTGISDGSISVEIRKIDASEKPGENTSEDSAAETKNYDLSSAEILKESAGKTEKASVSDIKADSMLEIEFNEDGSVKTVIIREKPEGQAPNSQAPEGQAPNGQAPADQNSDKS